MADEETQNTNSEGGAVATADPGVEGGPGESSSSDSPPSLADRLALPAEEREALDDELKAVPLEDVESYVSERMEEVKRQQEQEASEARAAEEAQARTQATRSELIAYHQTWEARRQGDESERAAFDAEMADSANARKFYRGGDMAYEATAEGQRAEAYQQLFAANHEALKAHKLEHLLPPIEDKEGWNAIGQKKLENGLAYYLIQEGKALGKAEAEAAIKEQARTEARRDLEQEQGEKGRRQMSDGKVASASRYTDPAWVTQQKRNDPDWARKPSQSNPDKTNHQMVKDALREKGRQAG